MRSALFGAALLAAAAAASDVSSLTKDTFKSFIGDNDLVLAEFFAPWCGHCKALAPEYEDAATQLKEKDIHLAKIDCTEEADLCQEYGVEGYPTLKVFRGLDSIVPYTGARKAAAIISYMTKQSMPAVSDLDSSDRLTEFKTADNVVLVAYFDKDDQASNNTFTEAANALRDEYLFGATNDAGLVEAEGLKHPSIRLYKSFDEGHNDFTEKFDKDAIIAWAKASATPLVGEVGPETYSGYMAAGIPLAYIFAETPEEREALAKELKPVAEKHKGKINFATIDAKAFGQHAGNLNLEVGSWPAFAIQETVKNQKFPYQQGKPITNDHIGKFVDTFVSGELEPSIKSEPIPETQEGPVTVVVAKNYQDVVIDNDKDVLVEFYAPWCGHCKALAPKYEELGALYWNNKDFAARVTIAKVDSTTNDVPDEIQGFPTIKLFQAGKKDNPLVYSGGRTVEELANFIKENGSHSIDAWAEHEKAAAGGAADAEKETPAAEAVKSKVSEAAAAVSSAVIGDDEETDIRDEL